MRGFTEVDSSIIRDNLSVAILGGPKTGKSSLALLSTPQPVALITNDIGEQDVLTRALGMGRKIFRRQLQTTTDVTTGVERPSATEKAKWTTFAVDRAQAEMELFRKLYDEALNTDEVRTVVIDTASNVHDLHRVAELGRLTAVEGHHYGPVNFEFRRLLEKGMRENGCDKHLILTHHLKKTYRPSGPAGKSEWTGGYEMKGYDGTQGMVDLVIQCDEVGGDAGLEATITACRKDRGLVGEKLPLFVDGENSEMFSYAYIYNMLYGKDPK